MTENAADRAADDMARTAGIAMDQHPGLSASQRVAAAVGDHGNAVVTALEARGDAHADGVIVLQFNVSRRGDGAFGTDVSSIRCYRYDIPGGYLDIRPHRIGCSDRPGVATSPHP